MIFDISGLQIFSNYVFPTMLKWNSIPTLSFIRNIYSFVFQKIQINIFTTIFQNKYNEKSKVEEICSYLPIHVL